MDFIICRLYKVTPCLQVIGHGCVLMYEMWWIFSSLMKGKKEKIRQMNFHCTVYTGTTWIDFAESHQLRTMNARCHINSVPWMTAVTSTPYYEWTRSHYSVPWMTAITSTPYHECRQFVDSVKPLLFRPIAYIHCTEFVWQRSVMVRSWCDLAKYKNRYEVTLASQSDFRSY